MSTTDILDLIKKVKAESPAGAFSQTGGESMVHSQQQSGAFLDPESLSEADKDVIGLFKRVKEGSVDTIPDVEVAKTPAETEAAAKQNLANRSEFTRGLLRGIDTTQAAFYGGLGMYSSAIGDTESAERRFKQYQEEMRQASENPATVDQFFSTDPQKGAFGSVGNFGTWVAGTAGNLLPSVAEAGAAGLAGAAAGGAIVPAPDPADVVTVPAGFLGGVFGRTAIKKAIAEAAQKYVEKGVARETADRMATQAVNNVLAKRIGGMAAAQQITALQEGGGMYAEGKEAGYDNPFSAIALGQVSGLSEVALGNMPLVVKKFLGKSPVGEAVNNADPKTAAGYIWDAVKNTGEEGVQEGFQEFLGSINEKINDPEKKLLTKENFMQWAEASAAGALAGAGFGGAGSAYSALQDRAERLKKLKEKGFISEEDAAEAGIEGNSRRERMANADAELEQIDQQIQAEMEQEAPDADIAAMVEDMLGETQPQVGAETAPPVAPPAQMPSSEDPFPESGAPPVSPQPTPLYEVVGDENMVARVWQNPQGFLVNLTDADSGEVFPSATIFPTFEQARQHADTVRLPQQPQVAPEPADTFTEYANAWSENLAKSLGREPRPLQPRTVESLKATIDGHADYAIQMGRSTTFVTDNPTLDALMMREIQKAVLAKGYQVGDVGIRSEGGTDFIGFDVIGAPQGQPQVAPPSSGNPFVDGEQQQWAPQAQVATQGANPFGEESGQQLPSQPVETSQQPAPSTEEPWEDIQGGNVTTSGVQSELTQESPVGVPSVTPETQPQPSDASSADPWDELVTTGDQQAQPQPESQDSPAQSEVQAVDLPEPKSAEEVESLPKFSLYRTTVQGKDYIAIRGDGRRGGGDELYESFEEASQKAESKRSQEQSAIEAAQKKSEQEAAAAEERAKNLPSYRDWRFNSTARNSGKIVPNKVGVKFLPDQMQSIANWAKSQGFSVSNVTPTGIKVLDPSGNRMDISMYGAAGVKDEKAKAAKAQRQENERKADEDRKKKADSRKSAPWISETFGGVINDYNRNALSDFLEGDTEKFKGMVSENWRSGLEKVGALSPEGKIDWGKVKSAYAAAKTQSPSGMEKISDWRKAVDESIESDPTRASSIMRRVASRTSDDAEAQDILDRLKDGFADRSQVAWDIGSNPKLSESVRRKAAKWHKEYGMGGDLDTVIDKDLLSKPKPTEPKEATQALEFNIGQGARPVPGMEGDNVNYTVTARKPDLIPDTFRVVIAGTPQGRGWLSVDGTGMTGEEAYERAMRKWELKIPGKKRDESRKAAIRKAIDEQGGFEANSSDDVDAIRNKLYDGADTPTGTEIRAVIEEMKIEAGRKAEAEASKPVEQLATEAKTDAFRALPAKSQAKFEELWNAGGAVITQALDQGNKAYRGEFEARTGIKLPKTVKGTNEAVAKWVSEGRKLAGDTAQSKDDRQQGLLDKLLMIEELDAVLENWATDDNRAKESYSIAELLDLAEQRLDDFDLDKSGGNELAEDLAGQNGAEAQKYAADQKRQIVAWIKLAKKELAKGESAKPVSSEKSPAQERDDRLDELEEARLFNENFIKIVADDVSKIRKQDVYRLLSEVPNERAGSFENWLIKKRPDLAEEINEVSSELLAERASQKEQPPAEGEMSVEDFVNAFVGTKQPEPKKGKKQPSAKAEVSPEEKTEHDKLKQNAVGVAETIRATKGGRSLLIEYSKHRYTWSIRDAGSKQDIAEEIIDLKRAKNIAERIFAGTFDSEADKRFTLTDNQSLAYSNRKLADLWDDIGRSIRLSAALFKTGFFTDGRMLVKVSEKDRDAILKIASLGTESIAPPPAIQSVLDSASKLPSYSDNEMSPAGYRGGELSVRIVVLKNKNGQYAIVDKAYHDTIMKRHPTAKVWGGADKGRSIEQAILYTVDGESVGLLGPMRVGKEDKYLTALLSGKYEDVKASEPVPPKEPKSIKKEPKEGVKEGLDKAKEGARLFIEGIKDAAKGNTPFANIPMNEKIAKGLGMMADGLIEAGKYKFVDFIDSVVELVGIQNARSYAKYLEAGWNKKAEFDDRLDQSQSVLALLEEKETEDGTDKPKFQYGDAVVRTDDATDIGRYEGVGQDGNLIVRKNGKRTNWPAIKTVRSDVLVDDQGNVIESSDTPQSRLAKRVMDALENGEALTGPSFFAMADEEFGGKRSNNEYGDSEATDALELGVNMYLQGKTNANVSPLEAKEILERIRQVMQLVPRHRGRTGNKETMQQFSTPPAYAYAVSWIANVTSNDVVLEPSAGMGGLAIHAANSGAAVYANELDEARANGLRELPIEKVFTEDAEQIGAILAGKTPGLSVIIMNPPFSRAGKRMGDKMIQGTDRKHIDEALLLLPDGGRLVAIIGAGLHGQGKKMTQWMDDLPYKLTANIEVAREVYRGYGTEFPTRVLVIDKVPRANTKTITGMAGDLEQLIDIATEVRNARQNANVESARDQQEGEQGTKEDGVGTKPSDDARNAIDTGVPEPASGETGGVEAQQPSNDRGDGDADARTGAGATGSNTSGGRRGGGGGGSSRKSSRSGGKGESSPAPAGKLDDTRRGGVTKFTAKTRPKTVSKKDELTDSTFEVYVPSISSEGARQHPAPIVESAAMAAVDTPSIQYEVDLMPGVFSGYVNEDGIYVGISDIQLEAIALAGAAHEQLLASGERRGFLIGDGTGVGKAREALGIIMDDLIKRGVGSRRKAVFITKNDGLVKDAVNEWVGVGGDPSELHQLSGVGSGEAVGIPNGILTVSYDTLKGEASSQAKAAGNKLSRVDQIVEWVGEDFDGVVVFDEAHLMANSLDSGAGTSIQKASQRALAGVDLQKRLPNARFVYLSATAATEVRNLAYAERLGLWGPGTEFASKSDFINEIEAGGVAAMEKVAADMKAMGMYIARNLSYDDGTESGRVEFDRITHSLTEDQRRVYDKLSEAWLKVLQNIDAALDLTDNKRGKSRIVSAFWSSNQRFWNDVIASMMAPTLIKNIEKDLKDGKSVILQLYTTKEAATNRAIAGMKEGQTYDEIDASPRRSLMEFVEKSFPVQRHEEYLDENNNVRSRPVVDSEGKPVNDPQAVAMKERLLDEIGSLDVASRGPIDMIIDYFGRDGVAEVSGRSQRLVKSEDGPLELEKRSKASSRADREAFMDGRKRILIFSEAGGTGASYHASLSSKNQQRRSHYLWQPGWSATSAVQGLGRAHRSNQASAPKLHLLEPNLEGYKRFISTVARRLAQLGALTKGQRTAADAGLFGPSDNLESTESSRALSQFLSDAIAGKIDGLDKEFIVQRLGFEQFEGSVTDTRSVAIPQFLNRILNLPLAEQNKVFKEFLVRFDSLVAEAIESGTLDQGMETLKALRIVKDKETVVNEHSSGAKTKLVELTVTREQLVTPFEKMLAERASYRNYTPRGFVKSKTSGKVFAVIDQMRTSQDKEGRITHDAMLVGVNGNSYGYSLEQLRNTQYWSSFENADDVREDWDKQFSASPKTVDVKYRLLTGALLPVWKKIASNERRVWRAKTESGEVILGRFLSEETLARTLERLGVDEGDQGAGKNVDKKTAIQAIYEGHSVELVNGWQIKKRTIDGQDNIEITGPDYASADAIRNAGGFSRRIDYATRFFIPFDDAEGVVLGEIAKISPIKRIVYKQGAGGSKKLDNNLRNLPDPLYQTAPDVNENMWSEALNLSTAAQNAGITNLRDFVAYSVKTIGRDRTLQVSRFLRLAAEVAGMEGVQQAAAVSGITRDQVVTMAKRAFSEVMSEDQIETGVTIEDITAFGRNEIGFAPYGTPVPGQAMTQSQVQTDTPAFKAWFGESKVVDENGKPLRLIHGTNAKVDFTEFSGRAFAAFGSKDTELTADYSRETEGSRSIPVYFKAEKPAYLELELNDTIVPEDYEDTSNEKPDDWDEDEDGEWKPAATDEPGGLTTKDELAEYLGISPDEFSVLYYSALKENEGWFGYPQVWRVINSNAFRKFLVDGGYDSFTATEGGSEVWAVIRPEQIKSATGNVGTFDPNNPSILMQEVANPQQHSTQISAELEKELDAGEKVSLYRAMMLIDGKLYPPMSGKVADESGKARTRASEPIGKWMRSQERPDLIPTSGKNAGKFLLKKAEGGGSDAWVTYAPYFHSSPIPLNDQFSAAWLNDGVERPQIVTVEIEVPKSELTSGYQADKSPKKVGANTWRAGVVASKIPGGRKVVLSRYARIKRIVPDAEVAKKIAEIVNPARLSIPENVVTPQLLAELKKNNVRIAPAGTSGGDIFYQTQPKGKVVKGWTKFISAHRALIGATNKADFSTFIHEFFHPMRVFLLDRKIPAEKRVGITDQDIEALEKYCGVKDGDWEFKSIADDKQRRSAVVMAEEKAAKAWEQYWFEGNSPNKALESLFQKISRWMREVYSSIQEITGTPLPKEIRDLFDKLVQRGLPADQRGGKGGEPVRGEPVLRPANPITSVQNEVANKLALLRGSPGLVEPESETMQEWLDVAASRLREDPMLGDRLVKELIASGRTPDQIEVAILQIHYRALDNALTSAGDRLFEAKDRKDDAAAAKALKECDALMNQLEEMDIATKRVGTTQARAFLARKIVLYADFSPAALLRKARVANGGEKLNEDQKREIAELARQIAELEGNLLKEQQRVTDLERQLALRQTVDDEIKQTKPRKPDSKRQKAATAVQSFVQKFSSVFKPKDDKTDTLMQTEDELMADEAEGVVKAYVEAGVYSYGELLANLRKDVGGEIPVQAKAAFATAWQNLRAQGEIPVPEWDPNDLNGLTKIARDIQKFLIEGGIVDEKDPNRAFIVLDAVWESLREIDPDITERQTMDALSGYGQFTPLDPDEVKKLQRDINGQLLQLGKKLDLEAEIRPKATGAERREMSPEERQLLREVNELKRTSKLYTEDRQGLLKSSISAALRATRNRIIDLRKAMRDGKPIVKTQVDLAGQDEDLAKERKLLAEVLKDYRDMFPRPGVTDAQRIAAAMRATDREIAILEEQIKTKNFSPKGRGNPVTSAELRAKQAELEAVRARRDAIRAQEDPDYENRRADIALIANLKARLADYEDRRAKGYFGAKPKKPPRKLSPEALEAKRALEDKKEEFFRLAAEYRLANLSPKERVFDWLRETSFLARAIMTSLDLSAVFRQGGPGTFSHPMLAKETTKEMRRAIFSQAEEFKIAENMRDHANYNFAVQAGLDITASSGKIQNQEEAYMGRWARDGIGKKGTKLNKFSRGLLKPVAMSARAYTTYLNGIRFRLFNYFVDTLGANGQVTLDEAKVIAKFINVSTGRSDLGSLNKVAASASTLLFAPRYLASRFQYLGMPFYMLQDTKTSGRVKKLIAMEYARHALGVAGFLTTAVALGSLLYDDEEEMPTVELDPRSTDFMKLKIGETRIDPLSGFGQVVTFMTQVSMGQKKSMDGEIVDVRGENKKWGEDSTFDIAAKFLRKKLAPIPAAVVNVYDGEDVVGNKATLATATAGLFIPLAAREVVETMTARGVPEGQAIAMLNLLGMSGGTYGPKTKYANANAEERKKILEADLKSFEWNSKDPAYKDFLSDEEMEMVRKRREHRKQSMVYQAAERPIRKNYTSDESFNVAVKAKDKATEALVKSGLSYEECRQLLIDYYKRNYGSAYQMKGGTYGMKESLVERIREIRKKLNAK